MLKPWHFALAAMLLAGDAMAQVEFRWFSAMGNGGTQVAGVRNAEGTYFRISCTPEGTIGEGASLQYDPEGSKIDRQKEAIQVVVDGEAFLFELDQSGLANLTPREQRTDLVRLADRLAGSRAGSFMVEVPRKNLIERFSLKDVQKALGKPQRTIVGAC